MTVIAWDGKTLAADKLRTTHGLKSTATKIYRVPQGIVGFAGSEVHAVRVLAWFENNRTGEFPEPPSSDEGADALFIDDKGHQWFFASTCRGTGIRRDDRFLAMGAGRDYALAAMYCGKSAVEAVAIACHFDNCCGHGFDKLTLDGNQR